MKKQGKERLFEVMGRLDKSFKAKLNEDFDFNQDQGTENTPEKTDTISTDATEIEPEKEEKSVEEKYEELKNKVKELYTIIQGNEEAPEEEHDNEEEIEIGTGENEVDEEKKPNIPVQYLAKVGNK